MSPLRYHIVTGSSSVGAPKQLIAEQCRSDGNRFDSIMAMLCIHSFIVDKYNLRAIDENQFENSVLNEVKINRNRIIYVK